MEIELNSAGDNPLVVVDDDAIVSVGNFDVVSLAMAFDYVRLGFAHAAQVANERVQKLLWGHFSGLPTGLASDGRADRRAASARALVRRARGRDALPRQPRLARLPRPDRRGHRGPRVDGAARGQHDLAPGRPDAPPRGARADRRRAGGRPARRSRRASARARASPTSSSASAIATLTDETEWNVDIDGLARRIGDGELARRVAAAIGGRPSLSEHEPPGI